VVDRVRFGISEWLIVSSVGGESSNLSGSRRSNFVEDCLDCRDEFLCILVSLISWAFAVAALQASISIAFIVRTTIVSSAPSEPSTVSSIDVHGYMVNSSKLRDGIRSTLNISLLSGFSAVRLLT
jgi:hypothetical protein